MSNTPPPPPPPRRLTRSSTDRVLGGVCGGLAAYLNVDATVVRVLAVVITLLGTGLPVVLYVVALLLVPDDRSPVPPAARFAGTMGSGRPPFPPPPHPGPRPTPPAGPGDPIWGREGAPWEQPEATAPGSPTSPSGGPATAAPGPGTGGGTTGGDERPTRGDDTGASGTGR